MLLTREEGSRDEKRKEEERSRMGLEQSGGCKVREEDIIKLNVLQKISGFSPHH